MQLLELLPPSPRWSSLSLVVSCVAGSHAPCAMPTIHATMSSQIMGASIVPDVTQLLAILAASLVDLPSFLCRLQDHVQPLMQFIFSIVCGRIESKFVATIFVGKIEWANKWFWINSNYMRRFAEMWWRKSKELSHLQTWSASEVGLPLIPGLLDLIDCCLTFTWIGL